MFLYTVYHEMFMCMKFLRILRFGWFMKMPERSRTSRVPPPHVQFFCPIVLMLWQIDTHIHLIYQTDRTNCKLLEVLTYESFHAADVILWCYMTSCFGVTSSKLLHYKSLRLAVRRSPKPKAWKSCFWPRDLDLWPITLPIELDLDMVQADLHVKFLV